MGKEVQKECMKCGGACARGYCDERRLNLAGAQYIYDIDGTEYNIVEVFVKNEKGDRFGLSGQTESSFIIPGGPCSHKIRDIDIKESHGY